MDYAFPFQMHEKGAEKSPGMTLREWYAGCALQGLLASIQTNALASASDTDANIARRCFALADQMIAAGGRK